MSGYYRDPTRQNQYNRYTYAREGAIPQGEPQGRPPMMPVKQLVARGASQYGQLPPIEGEHFGRTVANKVKNAAVEGIKIEALQAGITGSWHPGGQGDFMRPSMSDVMVPKMGNTDFDAKTYRQAYKEMPQALKSGNDQRSKKQKTAGANIPKGMLDDLPY